MKAVEVLKNVQGKKVRKISIGELKNNKVKKKKKRF